jgi:hypothetical protein
MQQPPQEHRFAPRLAAELMRHAVAVMPVPQGAVLIVDKDRFAMDAVQLEEHFSEIPPSHSFEYSINDFGKHTLGIELRYPPEARPHGEQAGSLEQLIAQHVAAGTLPLLEQPTHDRHDLAAVQEAYRPVWDKADALALQRGQTRLP